MLQRCATAPTEDNQKVFGARSQVESVFYMVHAAATNTSAVAVSSVCGDALYLKAYATLDLGHVDEAQALLEKAVERSPVNSLYLSELANIFQLKKDWNKSLELFQLSEEYAQSYSPDEVKVTELTRAKRGVGYNLTELGRFDEAQKKYEECLALNKNDKTAQSELQYILSRRKLK